MRPGAATSPALKKAFEEFRRIEQLQLRGQREQALEASKALASKHASWPYGHYSLAVSLMMMGNYEDARRAIRKAIARKENIAAFHRKLGEILHRLDDLEGARKAFDRAIELEPAETSHRISLAWSLRLSGQLEEARAILESLYDQGVRDHSMVRIYANLLGELGEADRAISILEPLTEQGHPDKNMVAAHWYVLARLYDRVGRYDDAYEAARRGADLYAKTYDEREREALFERRCEAWNAETMPELARSGVDSEKPVFVVGMPRSGTTLVEQIISSHPQAYGAGERTSIFTAVRELVTPIDGTTTIAEMARGLQKAALARTARRILRDMEKQAPSGAKPLRICDKLLLNFQHLGLIEQLFPNARVVICSRNPLDNFVSSYLLDFEGANTHAYTYRPEWFAHFYGLHRRYVEHYKSCCSLPILEVSYEDVVCDQRAQTERLLSFLGLPFDEACMNFHELGRAVNTASTDQVRRKLYSSAVGRWKNYDRHLGPLREALDRYGIEHD